MARPSWDATASALRESFHVYSLDLRGHGESKWATQYTLTELVDDLLAFVDELGLDRIVLTGLSLGGAVAAEAAVVDEKPGRSMHAEKPVSLEITCLNTFLRRRAVVPASVIAVLGTLGGATASYLFQRNITPTCPMPRPCQATPGNASRRPCCRR
jgi:pimeloyl-ACP methyl ester carboxylesterase